MGINQALLGADGGFISCKGGIGGVPSNSYDSISKVLRQQPMNPNFETNGKFPVQNVRQIDHCWNWWLGGNFIISVKLCVKDFVGGLRPKLRNLEW